MAILVFVGSLYRCCQTKQAGDRDTMLHRCPGNPTRFDSKHRKREVTSRANRHLGLHLPQRFHPDIPPLPRMPMLPRASFARRHASNPPHTAEREARYHLRRFRRFTHHAQPIHPKDPAQRRKNMGSSSLSGTIKFFAQPVNIHRTKETLPIQPPPTHPPQRAFLYFFRLNCNKSFVYKNLSLNLHAITKKDTRHQRVRNE